ncbi:S1C family serine protease [Carbonactinospora thermoautotrophica]|nr:trypsin-like peptidase domain-containing protein [Carbonactinospora thermoautotrophica]
MKSQDAERAGSHSAWWSKPGDDPWAPPESLRPVPPSVAAGRPAEPPGGDTPSPEAADAAGTPGGRGAPAVPPAPDDPGAVPASPVPGGAAAPASHGASGAAGGWGEPSGGPEYPWAPPAEEREVPGRRARERARRGLGSLIAVGLVAGLVGGGVGWFASSQTNERIGGSYVELPTAQKGTTDRPPGTVASIAEAVLPAVVSISVSTESEEDTGSGFVIRPDGYILTNHHVVASALDGGTIEVRFPDARTATAKIVGQPDAQSDLAVIKVDGMSGLVAARLGNSDSVVVGDPVVAIGSPLGLAGTVTSGIISAKDRPVTAGGGREGESSFINALQTDAAINPGNSGGPLVNGRGEVIGVNSAIATLGGGPFGGGQQGNIGLGFAIPINQAKNIAEQIINKGRAVHPVLGVSLDPTYQGVGARIIDDSQARGGQRPVLPGSPAEKAGLQPGDVIVQVDDRRITTSTELVVTIRDKAPGSTVKITYKRGSETRTVDVTLATDAQLNQR